jgi:hypothetical protein
MSSRTTQKVGALVGLGNVTMTRNAGPAMHVDREVALPDSDHRGGSG